MPSENNFQHDELSRKSPGDRLRSAELTPGALPESPAWFDAMAQNGAQLAQAGVRAIVLLHGSIIGTDVFGMQRLDEVGGLKRGYSRGVSGVDALLAAMREGGNGIPPLSAGLTVPLSDDETTKKALDAQVGDAGNFTASYAGLLQQALNKNLATPIPCVRMLWSSAHHHVGRALAAVQLLSELRTLCEQHHLAAGNRILLVAHGQAGLVAALASNLLCPSPITGRPKLFHLLTTAPQAGHTDAASLIQRIEPLLNAGTLLNGAHLDIVTLGTPVRYGWDPSGIGRLLHVVNHRNLRTDGKTWLSKMELPQVTMEMPIAWGGDYVQELAVAGSDAVPASEAAKAVNKAV